MSKPAGLLLPNSNIESLGLPEELDFFDSQSIDIDESLTALEVWNRLMSKKLPGMQAAFWVRDAISTRFGIKKIGGFSGERTDQVAVGDKLDFFLAEAITADRLTLTERDHHLDVMTCISVEGRHVTISSSVITHNLFGKAYMLPVAPAHKLIVWLMLRGLKKGS